VRRKTMFWLLFSPLTIVSLPILLFFAMNQAFSIVLTYAGFYGIVSYALYKRVYRGIRPKYPVMPPDGKPDIYYAAGIPRPIHEDERLYPWFFKRKRKKPKKTHDEHD